MLKNQPIAAPNDVRRYFVTFQESGELCLMSCLTGSNRDIFFPKLNEELNLITFSDIATRFLQSAGYEPVVCSTEEEARRKVKELSGKRQWPCYFFKSDTTGEKDFEEFYMAHEMLDLTRFTDIGIVRNEARYDEQKLEHFQSEIERFKKSGRWNKGDILNLFKTLLPEFEHEEKGKYLDSKM